MARKRKIVGRDYRRRPGSDLDLRAVDQNLPFMIILHEYARIFFVKLAISMI